MKMIQAIRVLRNIRKTSKPHKVMCKKANNVLMAIICFAVVLPLMWERELNA